MKNKSTFLALGMFLALSAAAQLNVTVDSNALRLAQIIVGPGIAISNARFIGNYGASGTFSGVNNMGIDTGVIFTSGQADSAEGPNNSTVSYSWFTEGDSDLALAINDSFDNTWDANGIQFDMRVTGDCIAFNYVFGSEEYPDWICTQYDDVFGIFISGPGITGKQNIALIPGTNFPICINHINDGQLPIFGGGPDSCPSNTYPQLFTNNGLYNTSGYDSFVAPNDSLPYYIQYNGFTDVFTASINGLQPNSIYHVKLVISDDGDTLLDSGVFIQAGPVSSNANNTFSAGPAYTTVNPFSNVAIAGCSKGILPVRLLHADSANTVIYFQIGGTAVNGTDYTAITDSLTFVAGDTLQNVIIQPLNTGQNGTKTVVLSFASGCGTIFDTLYVGGTMQVLAISSDSVICPGDTARICATPGFVNYSWNTGDTAACIKTTYAGNYYVTVSDNGQCSATSNSVNLAVYQPSPVTVSISGDTLTSYSAGSYQWFLNGVIIPGATGAVYIAQASGTYTLQVTGAHGCAAMSSPILISGITSELSENSVVVFPNPTSTGWQLTVTSELIGSVAEVFDASGRLVFKSTVRGLQSQVAIPYAASGVYELRITSDEYTLVRKLIKM